MPKKNPSFHLPARKQGRRKFIKQSVLLGSSLLVFNSCRNDPSTPGIKGTMMEQEGLLGDLQRSEGPDYLDNAVWYEGNSIGDGITYRFPEGALSGKQYLTADMLADGWDMVKFQLILQEGADGPAFTFQFGVLNQCSLRVRMPLSLVDQNRWGIDREGAFLKPRCGGDRVDLSRVDRMRLIILRKSPKTVRFSLTPFQYTASEVPVIAHPLLPQGKLIDDIGQSTLHQWPEKTSDAGEMVVNLKKRNEDSGHEWPENWSGWGGWKDRRLDTGTGFFRVHRDGERWWLIDPEGYYFWSAGVDCVRVDTTANFYLLEDALSWIPDPEGEYRDIFTERDGFPFINYLAANFIRTFGADGWRDRWAELALDELKRLRFNTVGNWSEWEYARRASFPYVRPMSFNPETVQQIYRDFPDVYHPDFEQDARKYAMVLEETKDDPALIGYFMMNEPKWAFSSELPAAGMLFNTENSETRKALAQYLEEKYTNDDNLSAAWEMPVSLSRIAGGPWDQRFTGMALADLETFSGMMVDRYFTTLADACRETDPNHLNLGIRYAGVPPKWAVAGMRSFDVFSMNSYTEKVPFEQTREIHDLLQMPVIIGEWHFGALDVGLPASGIGHVPDQEGRGKAYRVYLEDAVANPYCIGTHWFTLYDQSALGRFDGENYNIGFLDVCHRPHAPLSEAAIRSHERLYRLATGQVSPYDEAPTYLPKLF